MANLYTSIYTRKIFLLHTTTQNHYTTLYGKFTENLKTYHLLCSEYTILDVVLTNTPTKHEAKRYYGPISPP